jgi:hypothetical protein
MGAPMTIVGAIIGSLVCGASGYFAGYMKGASKWFDEIEDRQTATILNNAPRALSGAASKPSMRRYAEIPRRDFTLNLTATCKDASSISRSITEYSQRQRRATRAAWAKRLQDARIVVSVGGCVYAPLPGKKHRM